jgi:SRSO17 transposase
VTTREDRLVADAPSVGPGQWLGVFDELMTRVGSHFSRVEPRRRARAFVLGLLAELPRKNCWTIAEHAGDPSPDLMQHLLARAKWDADSVRDEVRGYVIEHLGDPGAVLVIDRRAGTPSSTASCTCRNPGPMTGTAARRPGSPRR